MTDKRREERLAALRERQEAVRERQAKLREERAAARSDRVAPRRRISRGWWVSCVLALLLLRECLEPDPIPEVIVEPCPEGVAGPVEPPPEPEPPPPVYTGRMKRVDRPEFTPPSSVTPKWLESFRMQVSARSPQLARCFEGAEAPGQMRWTTTVDVVEGGVSSHGLEPMLLTQELSPSERECVLQALSEPGYTLTVEDPPATPPRVSLVIEF